MTATVRALSPELRRMVFPRRRRSPWRLWVPAVLLALALLASAARARAEGQQTGFTPQDTLQALQDASDATGVPVGLLRAVVGCETGWTFNPYSIGALGEEGAVQLYPRGSEWPRFAAWGGTDPFDPYQAVPFLATEIQAGRGPAWSCWWLV